MVSAWNEKVSIPTYLTAKPEKYPMFFEQRVYQGSSGVVYPYPVIEAITGEKEERVYNALFLENEYLKVMILPDLGGRVQMLWDKINKRHVVYYNSVIKPALVGLTGPWISGGIEFNWPQHHRPGTFLPLDFRIEKPEDGSCTVWVIETERMTYQKSMSGFTLHPGKAYLEVKVRLINGTPFPQTFLWWANPAVSVNDDYQAVFPPDVRAVYDHGKRDVSSFPVANGVYYKIDYSEGVDISMYRNIPVPTSFMAVNSKYDFVGGYDHNHRTGMIHLANHRISPGKKLWTWGNSDFGKAWIQHLTDNDGPYLELMAGVYTDNQPDFSWLKPYEEKSFSQFFIPYQQLGVIKNASREVLLNLEIQSETAEIRIHSTSVLNDARIVLEGWFDRVHNLSPESVFVSLVNIGKIDVSTLKISIYNNRGQLLLSYSPEKTEVQQTPEPARAVRRPEDIQNSDELYFTGLHLEQYRHASLDPTAYYRRAIFLNPHDYRNNLALGLWLLRRCKFGEAEDCFRKAESSVTRYNLNPASGEAAYNLGLSLRYQYRFKEAYDAFYKAAWCADVQDAAWFQCALVSSVEGRFEDGINEVSNSILRNSLNQKANALRIMLMRKLGHAETALLLTESALKPDDTDIVINYERYLLSGDSARWESVISREGFLAQNFELAAFDYAEAGLYAEAIQMIELCLKQGPENPVLWYTLAWLQWLSDINPIMTLQKASAVPPDHCFPNRIESLLALEKAVEITAGDYSAHYYLGNLWYDKRQYDMAIRHWETALSYNPHFPAALRNLAIAVFNRLKQPERALGLLESAFRLDSESARLFYELDQLRKLLGQSPVERLEQLKLHFPLVRQRDDLYLEFVTLYNISEKFEMAVQLLEMRQFHPWEGGEGKVLQQYRIAHLGKAVGYLAGQQYAEAISYLNLCLVTPGNLGEGKLPLPQDQDVYFLLGLSYENLKDPGKADSYWRLATLGDHELSEAVFYNDLQPDRILYQAKAWQMLGDQEKARHLLDLLMVSGNQQNSAETGIDYFAVSLPNMQIWDIDLSKSHALHCQYLHGLGLMGSGDVSGAERLLRDILKNDPGHQGAMIHLKIAAIPGFIKKN